MWNLILKMIQMNIIKLTDIENKLMVTKGEMWGRDKSWVHAHPTVHKMDNQWGPDTQDKELYWMLCKNTEKRISRRVCITESLAAHLN